MSAPAWELHPQLAADCHRIDRLGPVWRLLHRNATLHWFILVPETSVLDLFDLTRAERGALMDAANEVSAFLKSSLDYPRVNVGALGLLVPQLHLHVIGRRPDDPCWPGPIWGRLSEARAYAPAEIAAIRESLQRRSQG